MTAKIGISVCLGDILENVVFEKYQPKLQKLVVSMKLTSPLCRNKRFGTKSLRPEAIFFMTGTAGFSIGPMFFRAY